MLDKKAHCILFDTYWLNGAWVKNPSTSPEDFEYAKSAGYMFEAKEFSHSGVLQWLSKSLKSVNIQDVSNAFLASLSTRRLDLRSAIGSFAIARHFPKHDFDGDTHCSICGAIEKLNVIDLNVLNFERHKWGGVRHLCPEYIGFDLERFAGLDKVTPTKEDLHIMRHIIKLIEQCEATTKPNDLEKRLATILKSNKDERRILIQILTYCGILYPNKHSFFDKFVNYNDRVLPSVHKIDWTYPVCWWRGTDRINLDALNYHFPEILTQV